MCVRPHFFHLLCFHVFPCVCFLLILNSAHSLLYCCANTSVLNAQRAAMSFSALPLLAAPGWGGTSPPPWHLAKAAQPRAAAAVYCKAMHVCLRVSVCLLRVYSSSC